MNRTTYTAILLAGMMIFPACREPEPADPPGGGGGPRTVDTTKAQVPAGPPAPVFGYKVLRTIPHEIGAFTQGLIYRDGIFYESTGLEGESSLRKVDAMSGRVLTKIDVPRPYFAEGMTMVGGKIYQLTWRSQTCFVYDSATLKPIGQHFYEGEGWGLT